MKNLYQKVTMTLISGRVNELKKDFSFYNAHTELLAIWTVLFMIITGLFVLAIQSNILVMFLLLILAIVTMSVGFFAATYYLYALKYHNREGLFAKIHNLLNKSFKLRVLFYFLKLPRPRFSIFDNIVKNFKFTS